MYPFFDGNMVLVLFRDTVAGRQAGRQGNASSCGAPTGNLEFAKRLRQPAKKCDSLPHPRVAIVERPVFDKTHLPSSYAYYLKILRV
jgi:hypothetical protein